MWPDVFGHGRTRKSLASALVGEIAAVMDAVETSGDIRLLKDSAAGDAASLIEVEGFTLPNFVVYNANADHLTVFDSPLPQELSYFYTEMSSLPGAIRAAVSAQHHAPKKRRKIATEAVTQVERVMELGEAVLRDLRRLVSDQHSPSITRA